MKCPSCPITPLMLLAIIVLPLAACALPDAHASAPSGPPTAASPAAAQWSAGQTGEWPAGLPDDEGLCANPTPAIAAECQALAQRLLAATARLELCVIAASWDGRGSPPVERIIGHGTVRNGRYLVTHNHYHLAPGEFGNGRLTDVTVCRADGAVVLNQLPSNAVTVTVVSPETLLFDFGTYGGQGLLSLAGFASAEFGAPGAADLFPGAAVAQIDWDGGAARVQWVRVMAVNLDDATPHILLDHTIAQGASGGGVFYRGVHIANNWTRDAAQLPSGEVVRQYSVAALDSGSIVALDQAASAGVASGQ